MRGFGSSIIKQQPQLHTPTQPTNIPYPAPRTSPVQSSPASTRLSTTHLSTTNPQPMPSTHHPLSRRHTLTTQNPIQTVQLEPHALLSPRPLAFLPAGVHSLTILPSRANQPQKKPFSTLLHSNNSKQASKEAVAGWLAAKSQHYIHTYIHTHTHTYAKISTRRVTTKKPRADKVERP